MTDMPITISLTLSRVSSMGLTILGIVFTLTALIAAARTGSRSRLFYTLFSFAAALYALTGWLPVPEPAGEILFCLTLLLYSLHSHYALRARSYAAMTIALGILFFLLTALLMATRYVNGSGTVLALISRPDWLTVAFAVTALFLLTRLITAFCFREGGSFWAIPSLLIFIVPVLAVIIRSNTLQGLMVQTFTIYSLPLLAVWEFIRLFTDIPPVRKDRELPPLGELREQLSESRSRQENLNALLADREDELGRVTAKARKVSRGLLPGVIHHDGLWEVTTFFSPRNRSGRRDFFDFYYTYGRKVAGVSLFETPEEPEGALYTALLKKEWTENFMETSSLASLYRRIDTHLQEIFPESALKGSVLKLQNDKIEYTGFGNPPLFYMNGKHKKSAPLIQDKTDRVQDIKSYTLPCGPGDSFLICNEVFLNKTAPVTDRVFAREELPRIMEGYTGKSADMVRELIDRRNRFLGRKDEADILVIYIKRKN